MMEQKATGREETGLEQTVREETNLEQTGPGQTAGAEAATATEKRTATGRCFPLRLASRTALALCLLPEAVLLADEMRTRHADWVEKCL